METIQSKRKLGQDQNRLDDNILFDVLDDNESDVTSESEESDSSDLEDDEPDTSSDDSSEEEEEEQERESSNEADSEEKDSDESEEEETEDDDDVDEVKARLPDQPAKQQRLHSAGLLRKKKKQREVKDEEEEEEGKTDMTEDPESSSDTKTATVPDEYEYDSSDEEDLRNTVGNIPMEWYKEYAHIGYDLLGDKILKGKSGDELDEFLSKMDDPNYWRTVKDKSTGQKVILSEKDVTLVDRFKSGKYVDPNYNPYEPWIDFFTCDKMIHPVSNRPEHKRSFIPSKWEKLKVGKIVHAMKMGWIKPKQPKSADDDEEKFYNLWRNDDQAEMSKRLRQHIPAPKMPLPGHEESYNPPPEYLLTEEEELAWKDQDPEERKLNYLPKSYSCLRQVPAYPRFINERFERCLDLYLCPRQRKMRMNVNPEDLIPKLPKPKELQPFPTTQSVVYRGHSSLVRCISVEPGGQWLVSGCDDKTIKFWEVQTGRCMKTLTVPDVVKDIAWNPNSSLCLVAAVVGQDILIINPKLGDKLVISNTDNMIESYQDPDEEASQSKVVTEWQAVQGQKHEDGFRLNIKHPMAVSQVCWHGRGDYCAVVMPQGGNSSVLIHQLSRRRSQNPFRKSKGLVQSVLFHPTRPFLFVATQRFVRIYNLLKQELSKKLLTNMKWVSSLAVHPAGDNCIIGSYDCKLSWFDLDLSTQPYQTLRHHKKAIRQVCYHKRYPLFASASDDGSIIVCHGMVYSDLLKNPLIVPVKVLRGHERTRDLGVLDCEFHPTQPWIFSSGSDHTIRLFT